MSFRRLARRAVPAGLVLFAGAAAPALAEHPKDLLARTPSGGQPNAPAVDPAISRDGRMNRFAAYASAATDIVPGSGSFQNVFMVKRAGHITRTGSRWHIGKTSLVSRGIGGPANGNSSRPTFDGYDYTSHGREITVRPKCLAFVSEASNLVPGDGNGHADVFIERLSSGRLSRIATPGPATEVALDGRCWTVAYVAGGTVYRKDLRHRRRARAISGAGGASSPELSASGKVATYARNGSVYVYRLGGGTHRVAPGAAPTADEFGRYVAYEYNSAIWRANIQGRARARQIAGDGSAPSMTAGGSFVFYVSGPLATSNVFRSFGTCPAGSTATQINGSPHGNYAAFGCSDGVLYLSYIGAK